MYAIKDNMYKWDGNNIGSFISIANSLYSYKAVEEVPQSDVLGRLFYSLINKERTNTRGG